MTTSPETRLQPLKNFIKMVYMNYDNNRSQQVTGKRNRHPIIKYNGLNKV